MKTIRTNIAEMSFDEKSSLLHIKILEGAEMNLENTKAHYETIEKITDGKEYYALIDASEYFTIDAESLKYASLHETIGKRIAAAHYNPADANKLTTSFFKNFYKPPIPVQIFNSKEEALNWLRSCN